MVTEIDEEESMETLTASDVSCEDLEKLEAAASSMPEDSQLRSTLTQVSSSVRQGRDVVVALDGDRVSPAVAARILGVSRTHLYKVLDAGDLPSAAVGRDRRISLSDLAKFMERQDELRKHVAERFAHPGDVRSRALNAYRKSQSSLS